MFKYLRNCFVVFFLFVPVLFSQNLENVNTEFKLAVNLYDALQYYDALKIFNRLSTSETVNSKTTASYVFKAKIELKLNRLEDAKKTVNTFLELFPKSEYAGEARLILARVYFEEKEYYESLKPILSIVETSGQSALVDYAKNTGEQIVYNFVSSSLVRVLRTLYSGEKTSPYLMLLLGRAYQKEGSVAEAKEVFEDIIKTYPASAERALAMKYLNSGLSQQPAEIVLDIKDPLIAAMLPLSGKMITDEQKSAASEILEGIRYALYEYNDGRTDRIGLIVKDTELDKSKITEIKNFLAAVENVKAVIGPIFSNEVREALEIFKGNKLPVISPTATDNGLTSLYENFYQANPSFALRGKIMAQYVFFVENKRRMGILNAIEGYSPLLAAEFQIEFEKLGGKIVTKETYGSNSFNLTKQISGLKAYQNQLEGIYIPITSRNDVPAILSEMVKQGLDAAIYGNQDWMLASGFETSPELSNKITFTSDYFIDFNSPEYQEFSKKYLSLTGKEPNRNVFYGYDTGKYILTVMRNIDVQRENISNKMESGIVSSGFHNNTAFDGERVNKFLNIIRYKDGIFELIDRFRAGK